MFADPILKRQFQLRERIMKIAVRSKLMAVVALLATAVELNAGIITYNDRASFEAVLNNIKVDDFESPSYGYINTAATMQSLSSASIKYESTFFDTPDWNIVDTGALCWGCNGSGQILLDATTIGSSDGVFGFGLDILRNSNIITQLDYDAFVTFGNGLTQQYDLGIGGPMFFGITSDTLIKSVHFTLENGSITDSGRFQVDNVTIGSPVPTPATIPLLGIALAALGFIRRRAKS